MIDVQQVRVGMEEVGAGRVEVVVDVVDVVGADLVEIRFRSHKCHKLHRQMHIRLISSSVSLS